MNLKLYLRSLFSPNENTSQLPLGILLIVCQLVVSVGQSLSAWALGDVIDSVALNSGFERNLVSLILITVVIAFFSIFRELCRERVNLQVECGLRCQILQGVFLSEIDTPNDKHGAIYETLTDQVNEYAFDAWQIIIKVVEISVKISMSIYLMFSMNIRISVFVVTVIPLLSIGTIRAMAVATKTHAKRQAADREYMAIVSEITLLMKELHFLPVRNLFFNKYDNVSNQKQFAETKHKQAVLFCRSVEKAAYVIGYVLVLCIGISEQRLGNISFGQIVAFMIYVSNLLQLLAQINYIYDMWVSNRELHKNMKKYMLDTPFDEDTIPMPGPIVRIDIQNLSYHTPNTQEKVIDDLTITLSGGELVVLAGPSGSGKSTFLKLLLKQLHPSGGSILFNNTPSETISTAGIRDNISYLAQVPFLFDGSVLENLHWANRELTRSNAELLLKKVGLGHLTCDTQIGEHGGKLSGGERQRLALARCIAKDASMMILDEPFAQLDKANERILIEYITKFEDKIVILSTHRLDVCQNADRVIQLRRRQT